MPSAVGAAFASVQALHEPPGTALKSPAPHSVQRPEPGASPAPAGQAVAVAEAVDEAVEVEEAVELAEAVGAVERDAATEKDGVGDAVALGRGLAVAVAVAEEVAEAVEDEEGVAAEVGDTGTASPVTMTLSSLSCPPEPPPKHDGEGQIKRQQAPDARFAAAAGTATGLVLGFVASAT